MSRNVTMTMALPVLIGYAKCGCLVAAHYEPTDTDIADMVREGYSVRFEEGPVQMGSDCHHVPKWGRSE